MRTLGVATVPKVILFSICRPEDPVPNDGNEEDKCGPDLIENVVLEYEVSRSRCVREGNPEKVSDRQHVSESIGRGIHYGKYSRLQRSARENGPRLSPYLVIDSITYIQKVEEEGEDHGIRQASTQGVLFASHADIDVCPEDDPWAKLVEDFEF
jgi:hypothetical protein